MHRVLRAAAVGLIAVTVAGCSSGGSMPAGILAGAASPSPSPSSSPSISVNEVDNCSGGVHGMVLYYFMVFDPNLPNPPGPSYQEWLAQDEKLPAPMMSIVAKVAFDPRYKDPVLNGTEGSLDAVSAADPEIETLCEQAYQ